MLGGDTNYEEAFHVAFTMIKSSRAVAQSSSCETIILFLTDGEPTVGLVGEDLIGNITSWNAEVHAKIFTYSLGSQAIQLPKAIGCANNGVWAQIKDGGDLAAAMGNYYNYLASSMVNHTQAVWTEPYIDASGAGEVVTVAKAFYDESVFPPLFLGVVGIDLLLSEFLAVESEKQLLKYLVERSAVCPVVSFTTCGLEIMRSQVVNANGQSSKCDVNLSCPQRDIPQQICLQQGRDYGFCDVMMNNLEEGECCQLVEIVGGVAVGVIVGYVVVVPLGVFLLGVIVLKMWIIISERRKEKEAPEHE